MELLGELTAFVDAITPLYKNVNRDEVRFLLIQAGDRLMPEIDPTLAGYGARVLAERRGVDLWLNTRVRAIESARSTWQTKASPRTRSSWRPEWSPVRWWLPWRSRRIGVVALRLTRLFAAAVTRRCGHWATVLRSQGLTAQPYPSLAQHALREARVLAGNIVGALADRPPQPFVYHTLGMMGSLGRGRGFGQFLGVRMYGFPAWFIRRTYYLLQMPGWGRRLRIVIDWTLALLFRPDAVKVGLNSETALLLREVAAADAAA